MGKAERLLAVLSVVLVFVYVVLRAIYVPTFHDEAATIFHYIISERFLPYQAHWDANNHLLNSALSYFCYKLLGPQQWWIRLPNVLSFLVYGFFVVRISDQIKNGLIRWMLLTALLTAAFLLEFFSLARGYAMSIAFLMGAIYHGSRYLKEFKLKDQFILWFWMWLAVAASLTLINSYLIFLGVVVLGVLRVRADRWKHVAVMLLLGMPALIAAIIYAFELKERGLLYTGLADGFVEVTVRSLVRYQWDSPAPPLANLIAAVGTISALFVLIRSIAHWLPWNAIRLTAVLLLLNAIASIFLNLLFGMNFPENRVGMYYIPLFLITVAGALDEWSGNYPRVQWLAFSFLCFPWHLAHHFNFNTSILWPRWHASDDIYQRAVEHQQETGEIQLVSGEYLNELGWAYYNFQNGSEMQLLQRDPVPDTLADLIIARPEDFDFTKVPYDTMFHDLANNVYLLRRNRELQWSEPVSPAVQRTEFNGSGEFYEILNDSVSKLSGNKGVWELSGKFTSLTGVFDGQLVMTSSSPNGGTYNMIPLHWIRSDWNADTLHVKRTYYFAEDATNVKVYFWNMHGNEISFKLDRLEFRSPN